MDPSIFWGILARQWVELNYRHRGYESLVLPLNYTAKDRSPATVKENIQTSVEDISALFSRMFPTEVVGFEPTDALKEHRRISNPLH